MFTRTESGLYRPRTEDENTELEMLALNAPLIAMDYIASISQVLSPRRYKELRSLARILRDSTEPHVRTMIPKDMVLRPERESDKHPCIQAGLKVELAYAYSLLQAGEQDEKARKEYWEEAARLSKEATQSFENGNFFMHAGVAYYMRTATLLYFRAAWNFLANGDSSITEEQATKAGSTYEHTRKFLVNMQSDEARNYTENLGKYGIRGISQIAKLVADSTRFAEHGIKADKESVDEFLTLLLTDQFDHLMQDVLFGQMRCYALLGERRKLKAAYEELTAIIDKEEIRAAPVITESAAMLMDGAARNSKWMGLKLNPYVSDSPSIVLEATDHILDSFGTGSGKLWKPGDKLDDRMHRLRSFLI